MIMQIGVFKYMEDYKNGKSQKHRRKNRRFF